MSDAYEEMLRNNPDLKRQFDLISKVGAESERGMAVLVGAELDRALDVLLKSYLTPGKARDDLFLGGSPPLGTFSAKINLARTLHLISGDEFDLLHLIRRIRNEFAHNPEAGFGDARISSWAAALPERERDADLKSRFTLCSASLIADLEHDAVSAANGRVREESYNTWYWRGYDQNLPAFSSDEEAAAAFRDAKSYRRIRGT